MERTNNPRYGTCCFTNYPESIAVHMEEALAVENLSKIGQILPVFDENTLLWWILTSTPY